MISIKACCRAISVWAGILLISAPVFAGDFTVVPGRSLGRAYIGESRAQVLRDLGWPSESEPSNDGRVKSISGLQADTWRGKDLEPFVSVSYRDGQVVQITTDNPRFQTRDGICVSSLLGQIRRRFPRLRRHTYPDAANHVRTHLRVYDPAAGIAFVNTNGASHFDVLTVYRPGTRLVHDVE